MKKPLTQIVLAFALFGMVNLSAAAKPIEKIQFFTDSIFEIDGKYMHLLGGTSWILSMPSLAMVTDEVVVLFRSIKAPNGKQTKVAFAYIDGDEIVAGHAGGVYFTKPGYLTTVVDVFGDGAVLKLADNTLLEVPQYDRFDTGWWLPPYKALLTGNKLYLYNLKKGKRVWVSVVK